MSKVDWFGWFGRWGGESRGWKWGWGWVEKERVERAHGDVDCYIVTFSILNYKNLSISAASLDLLPTLPQIYCCIIVKLPPSSCGPRACKSFALEECGDERESYTKITVDN